ncbi:EF-hand domain-containing protein [Halovulum sp. GXIMD14793]
MGAFTNFGKSIFAAMDQDDNESITYEEFADFDFGFEYNVRDDAIKLERYDTARRVLFAMWDRDADGEISSSEYNKSMVDDFRRADLNNDAMLSEEEFTTAYIVGRAYRAALLEQ